MYTGPHASLGTLEFPTSAGWRGFATLALKGTCCLWSHMKFKHNEEYTRRALGCQARNAKRTPWESLGQQSRASIRSRIARPVHVKQCPIAAAIRGR
jgi:hypothetical protein